MWMYGVWWFLYVLKTFGYFMQITIEGEKTAVWYFSRSHSVKSEPFDFTQVFIRSLHAPHD